MGMRIYQINVEHIKHGMNWSSFKLHAINFDEALRKSKQRLERGERIESVELVASTDTGR